MTFPYFSKFSACELNPFYGITSSTELPETIQDQFPILCNLVDNGFCAFCIDPEVAQSDPEYSVLFDMRDTSVWCYLSLDEFHQLSLEIQILTPKLKKFIELLQEPNQ
jgi:hypothetical protein